MASPVVEARETPRQSLKSWWNAFTKIRLQGSAGSRDKKAASEDNRVFGVPLRKSLKYASVAISMAGEDGQQYVWGYVPVIVAKVGLYLKENAVDTEGVFRIAGSQKRMRELQETFDLPPRYGKDVDWTRYSIHDAASVLRRYLNQMPEPIIPLHLYNEFRNIIIKEPFDASAAIKTYRLLIISSPPANQYLLLYVLDLLAVFARASDKNLMPASNLAVIFQPGIFSHPTHLNSSNEHKTAVQVLEFLIEHQDHFVLGLSRPPPANVSPADLTVAGRAARPDEVYFEPSDSDEDLGVLEAHEGGGAALARRSASGRAKVSGSSGQGRKRGLFGRRGSKGHAMPAAPEMAASMSSPGLLGGTGDEDKAKAAAEVKAAEAKAAEAERVRTQVIEPRGLAPSSALSGSASSRASGEGASQSSSTAKVKRRRTAPTRRTKQEAEHSAETNGSRGAAEPRSKENVPPMEDLSRTRTAEEDEEQERKKSSAGTEAEPEKTVATEVPLEETATPAGATQGEPPAAATTTEESVNKQEPQP